MSQFTDVLLVSPVDDGKSWVLMRGFGYARGSEDSGDVIEVPKGFVTDFASVPRLIQWLVPRWGKYGNAAIIHDWLYWQQEMSRREADRVFIEAMDVMKVFPLLKHLIYAAVRIFGWIAWLRNRADRASGFNRVLANLHIKAGAESRRRGSIVQLAKLLAGQYGKGDGDSSLSV